MIEQALLVVDGLPDARVTRVRGREAMNALTEFAVEVLCPNAEIDADSLVDQNASLGIADSAGVTTSFHLVVREAAHLGHFRGEERLRLTLAPPEVRLCHKLNHEIFQDLTTQELVQSLLARAGLSAHVQWRLVGQYAKRVYTVQYGETDWTFLARLLADEGINCWFDLAGEETRLVFGDHPSSHDGIEGDGAAVPFQDASGMNASSFALQALRRTWSICPTRASLLDVDVQNPDLPVFAEEGEGALEIFEYPSNLVVPEAAKARAKVRLSQLRRHRSTLVATSGNARLRAGRVVEIFGAADDCFSGKFLITAVDHELVQASQDEPRGMPYHNRVSLVPFDADVPYRPAVPSRATLGASPASAAPRNVGASPASAAPRNVGASPASAALHAEGLVHPVDNARPSTSAALVSRPQIEGLETAVVTGPPGEEIHVDDLGRVKLRFFWDRSGIGDDKSSRWIRTLQMNLVAPQMLPRVGWEVSVVYEDGNPDRPFVLGRLYNGGAPPPYGMPGKKATSTLQSATSPGGGTTQEIRMGDDAGSEQVFVHATKDQTVQVGGAHLVKVSANRSDDVQKTQTLGVTGGQSSTVGGNQKITVGGNGVIVVKGARSETIGGNETLGVTGSYALTVKGAYTELVGGLYSLRCNQSNATVQGAFTQVIGAALSTTAGLGSNQSVAGARTEVVGGARSFAGGLAYADGTTGVKRITAGAANESASADMAFSAGARAQLQAGGALSIEGGGKVVFEAATISIKAATLTAKGGSTMKLAGSLKSSSKVKLDSPTVKKTKKQKVQG